jgi:hypothetical protein
MSNDLDRDLGEAAALEGMPRGPGRPAGAKNKSSSRTSVRNRVRAFRERQREKAEEAEEARTSQEKLFNDMRNEGLLFFGETSPTINCISIQEETEMARIWARLLNVRDIRPGENQRNYILDVMRAWVSADCRLLHFGSLSLSTRKVDPPDVEQFVWPEGSDAPFEPDQPEIEVKAVTP